MRPYITTNNYKKKHKSQVTYKMIVCKMTVCKITICKMTVCKIIQFARLQATNENARNGKRTNLKELPRPQKLSQGTQVESVEYR